MNVKVTEQTLTTARGIAKSVHLMMVASYSFDGTTVKPLPAIALRDTIAAKLVEPEDLLRVQLTYPEAGPDDRWHAACEALLGGGIEHRGRKYVVLGGSSSLKKGVLWCATEKVRDRLHRYFCTSQEALSYLGVFFSGCHHGIHRLEGLRGIVVEDGEFGTADGMGFISPTLLEQLGLPLRQLQVRLVSDVAGEEWLAKGTQLPFPGRPDQDAGSFVTFVTDSGTTGLQSTTNDLAGFELNATDNLLRDHGDVDELGDVDFVLPKSMIKGKGTPPAGPWTVWFGIRDVARTLPYASSFSFAQWFDDDTLDAVWSVAEARLDTIKGALSNRDGALRFLGLQRNVKTDQAEFSDKSDKTTCGGAARVLNPARTRTEAFLEAGLEPDHPWLQRQLVQLMRRSFLELALGGGIELTGRMGAWADLTAGVICAKDLPAGPVVLSRYPVRDPHSIMAVWNERDAVDGALPGTVYLNNDDALQLVGDFDGDYYIVCTQEAVVDAVSSPAWYPDYRRQDVPPKKRRKDSLDALPFVAVSSLGNRIGSVTYLISAGRHHGRMDMVSELSASLQAEVQSLKWDTHADRSLLNDPALTVPDYIADAKTDRDLFIRHAEEVEGDFPLIRNYNRVVRAWSHDLPATRQLLDFKRHVPIWKVPTALNHVEEAKAVVMTYNRWIASIIQQVKDPSQDDLAEPISFLEAWDRSKMDDRDAWGAALWHVVHGTRADSTGSAAFHAFTEQLVTLIADTSQLPVPQMQTGATQSVSSDQTDDTCDVAGSRPGSSPAPDRVQTHTRPSGDPVTIPLSGALISAGDDGSKVRSIIQELASNGPLVIHTTPRDEYGTAFHHGDQFLGTIPRDHLLYGSVPAGLQFPALIAMRGRTVYMMPTTADWWVSVQN